MISGLGLVLVQEWELLQKGEYSARTAKQLTLTVIEAIDMFLVGAISYIIAVGIYILFIGQEDDQSFKRFKIENLADLETKSLVSWWWLWPWVLSARLPKCPARRRCFMVESALPW